MTRKLEIHREIDPELTATPYFSVKIVYENCQIAHDDIFFDGLDDLTAAIASLEESRKGDLLLDGGFRFKIKLQMGATGSMMLKVMTEAGPAFPGKLTLEGDFPISGEYVASTLNSLIGLLRDGEEFVI